MELTLTIPKISVSATRQFIAVPYDEYQLFLEFKKSIKAQVRLTASQKKRISESEQELARGEYCTLEALEYELLENTHSKTSRKRT